MALKIIKWPKRSFLRTTFLEIQLIDNQEYNLRVRVPNTTWKKHNISIDMYEALLKEFNTLPIRNNWHATRFPALKEFLENVLDLPEVITLQPKKQRLWLWEEHPNILASIMCEAHTKLTK